MFALSSSEHVFSFLDGLHINTNKIKWRIPGISHTRSILILLPLSISAEGSRLVGWMMNTKEWGLNCTTGGTPPPSPLQCELWGHFLFFFFFFPRKSLWRVAPLSTSEVSNLGQSAAPGVGSNFGAVRQTRGNSKWYDWLCQLSQKWDAVVLGERLNVCVKYQTPLVKRSVC